VKLPSGWTRRTLGDVAEIASGGNAPQGEQYFQDGKHPFVRVQHFDGTTTNVTRWDLITDEAVRDYRLKLVSAGTILLPKSGASIRLEKRAVLPVDAYVVSHFCTVKAKPSECQRFLFCLLKTIRFSQDSNGSTLPFLNLSRIADCEFSCPPLPEQKKIAAVLAKIQRAVELQEAILANVRELKKSLMHRLFTEGLRGEASSWETATIGDTCSILNGYAFSGDDYADEGIVNFRVVNIRGEGRVNLTDDIKFLPISFADTYREYLLKAGDILLVMVGATRGKLCILTGEHLPALMNQNMWRIVPQSSDLDRDFLYYFLCFRIPVFMKQFSEEARGFFKKGDLRKEPIPMPSPADQVEIATTLRLADQKIAVHESKKTALQDLFKTTLNQLITGAVRVQDLDIDTSEVEAV
jgi:type I restriction enzyme, S subunit